MSNPFLTITKTLSSRVLSLCSTSFSRISTIKNLNLSKYLNKEFLAFDTLMAENFYKINDLSGAKNIYKKLSNYGNAFKWYSNKQISKILIQEKKKG